jgi:hypothetical protein
MLHAYRSVLLSLVTIAFLLSSGPLAGAAQEATPGGAG